jgi:hypothetical protein
MSGYEDEITGVSWSSGDLDQVSFLQKIHTKLASCSDDRKVRVWRHANTQFKRKDETFSNSNSFTVSEAKEGAGSERYKERYYCDLNTKENISPEKSWPSKPFVISSASSKKRHRRISDYFSPQSEA